MEKIENMEELKKSLESSFNEQISGYIEKVTKGFSALDSKLDDIESKLQKAEEAISDFKSTEEKENEKKTPEEPEKEKEKDDEKEKGDQTDDEDKLMKGLTNRLNKIEGMLSDNSSNYKMIAKGMGISSIEQIDSDKAELNKILKAAEGGLK